GAWAGARRTAGCIHVLRIRRDVRDQERRRVHGDAGRQNGLRAGHPRRGMRGQRLVVLDAHRRRTVSPERPGGHGASGGDPGVVTGHLSGAPFPEAARAALADTQLRRNLRRATSTIRAKRAAVVEELPDWAALRETGAAIKDDVLANLDRYLVQLEEQIT